MTELTIDKIESLPNGKVKIEMIRPWTPGPWLIEERTVYALQPNPSPRKGMPDMVNRWFAGFQVMKDTPVEEVEANALLSSKSPGLAEMLIEIIDDNDLGVMEVLGLDRWERIINLLKECGYPTSQPSEMD